MTALTALTALVQVGGRRIPGRALISWSLLCGLAAIIASTGPVTGAEPLGTDPLLSDPWNVLAEVRDQLRAESPLATTFTQTFLPSGFSTGDMESGVLFIDLPRCLRFEYREPFPKNFLLCGDWVYTWNPGDPSGRRFLTNDGEAEGLDLLRLEVDVLKTRYRAEFSADEADRTVIRLIPEDEAADIREASIEIGRHEEPAQATAAGHLLALAYEDRSGNQTRFEITDHRKLETRGEFEPPTLEWLED